MQDNRDDEISGDINAAFAASPRIHSTEIRVRTIDGRVLLRGVVETLEEKLASEETAARVRGVRAIENDLTVSADKDLSVLRIERMAQRALDDAGLAEIGVRVEAGNAFLMGHIRDIAIEDRARDVVAQVEGVRDVLSELVVAAGEPLDDITLADFVAEALSDDRRIVFYKLEVRSDEGHVTIIGDVDSPDQTEIVTQVAESVPGVKSVENLMTVVQSRV
jgi:hyperosmotically inducible periplasmic protein